MNHRNHHPHGNKQMEALIASNFNLPNKYLGTIKYRKDVVVFLINPYSLNYYSVFSPPVPSFLLLLLPSFFLFPSPFSSFLLLPSSSDLDMYKFMDFVYLSQVMQGLCMRAQVEHYRRFISKEGVLTRGTLYWQLVRCTMCKLLFNKI